MFFDTWGARERSEFLASEGLKSRNKVPSLPLPPIVGMVNGVAILMLP